MFETPTLFRRPDHFEIYVPSSLSERLLADLSAAGFSVNRFDAEIAFEDLNDGVRTDLAILDLSLSVDVRELANFLRRWNAGGIR